MPAAGTNVRLAALLDRGAQVQRDNVMIEARPDGSYETITYGEALVEAKRIALALAAHGVRRGDRVATLCWNTNRHLQLYHAVACFGAVLHPLNLRLGTSEQAYIIKHAGDTVLFADEDLLPRLRDCDPAALANLRLVVVMSEVADELAPGSPAAFIGSSSSSGGGGRVVTTLRRFLAGTASPEGRARAAAYAWPEDIDEHSPVAMCYTSGTTGNPKGVVYSHRGMFMHTLAFPAKDNHNVGGADVLLPVVPYFHANGWGIPYAALMLGARIVHNRELTDPASILRLCVDHGVTYSAAVPTIWQTVRSALQKDLESFRGRFKVGRGGCVAGVCGRVGGWVGR